MRLPLYNFATLSKAGHPLCMDPQYQVVAPRGWPTRSFTGPRPCASAAAGADAIPEKSIAADRLDAVTKSQCSPQAAAFLAALTALSALASVPSTLGRLPKTAFIVSSWKMFSLTAAHMVAVICSSEGGGSPRFG